MQFSPHNVTVRVSETEVMLKYSPFIPSGYFRSVLANVMGQLDTVLCSDLAIYQRIIRRLRRQTGRKRSLSAIISLRDTA